MADWISLVESAYRLDGDLRAWLDEVLGRARVLLDRGHGVYGYVFARRSGVPSLPLRSVSGVSPELLRALDSWASTRSVRQLEANVVSSSVFASLSEFTHRVSLGDAPALRLGAGFADIVGLSAVSGSGHGLSLAAPSRATVATTRVERRRWTAAAAHLGAGLRLRLVLGDLADAAPPEAVLDASAKLHDAAPPAQGVRTREWLREAVRLRERARTRRERADPDAALALWEGLVAGRWSLVDRFESDGRRFVVAHRNDPDVGDPRGLTLRERQVAEYVGLGRSQKDIAYLFGLSPTAVSNATRRGCEKLGLQGLGELASFFAPGGLRARIAELEVGGERLVVGSAPLLDAGALDVLSPAEAEVALDLVRGATLDAIAERRGSSLRTVETQVKSVYAKLGVHSRVELAARLETRAG